MDSRKLSVFITAVQAGSLSAASQRLGLQLSTISRQIVDLETELGAQLLTRTGRGVRLTNAGERFIERARHILQEVEAAAAEARGEATSVSTTLRISAPVELALRLLPPVVAEFSRRNPGVSIDVHSAARRVSLLEEEFDAAIRLGALPDSGYLARRLGGVGVVLCASPETAGRVRTASEIAKLPFVRVAGTPGEVKPSAQGKFLSLVLDGPVQVSTFSEAAEVSACGPLAVMLPIYTAFAYLASGRLVRLAPELSLPPVEINLLMAKRNRHTAGLREFGDLVRTALSSFP
jgi:DNA-binding transcriptional LysR family regulator